MAINKKLIHFETLAKFQSADGINTTSATQTPTNDLVGNIPYHSIVFIKDVCKFWTHGKYYDCNNTWRGIQNNLTSTSTTDSLSAYQGKILNEKFANYLPLSGGTLTGALTVPSLTVTGASSFSQAINASILGNAATASRLQNARTISLTGSVTGSGSFDGSGNLSIATTTNHSHAYFPYQYISGDSLTSAVNLNTITDSLKFVTVSWSYSGYLNVTNSPWSSSAGNVFHLGGAYPMQIASFYNTSTDVYIRTYYSGNGWKDWKKIAFAGEALPASDVYAWAKESTKPSYTASEVGALKNYGNTNSRPNSTTFILPGGANPVSMRSGATSGADIGIFYLSDDNAFVCNSSDNAYLFAAFDTDKTVDFSAASNAAFAVLSNHEGVSMKGNLTVAGTITSGGTAVSLSGHNHDSRYVMLTEDQTISGNKSFSGSTSLDDTTIGNLVVTGGASFAQTINGTIDKALKDGSGNTITSTYVKKSGDTMTGLLTTTTGSNHAGLKVGDTYINSIGGELILQNNTAIRFGGDSWDWNVWAGLKYVHSSKIVYLGLADGSAFTANSALSGGKLYTPGISNIYIGNGTYTVYHTGNLSIGTLMGSTAIGDSDEPVYWSGTAFVKAGAYPTKASWNYDDVYLKLSGGNLTGDISTASFWSGTDSMGLYIEGNSDKGVRIQYPKTISGSSRSNYDQLVLQNGVLKWNNNTVWHAGNDGADSGLDADTVDGKHYSDIILSNGRNLVRNYNTETTSSDYQVWTTHVLTETVNSGDKITITVEYSLASGATKTWLSVYTGGGYASIASLNATAGLSHHVQSVTTTMSYASGHNDNGVCIFYGDSNKTGTCTIHRVKVERGDHFTGWSPAPEDLIITTNIGSQSVSYASNVGASGTAGTNYVTAANVISMYNWYNGITATDEASNTAIDKWNEIVSFLAGITDTSTLSGILAGYAAVGHDHDGTYLKLSNAGSTETITGLVRIKDDLGGNLSNWVTYQHNGPFEVGRSSNAMTVAIGVTDDNYGYIQTKGINITTPGDLVLLPGGGNLYYDLSKKPILHSGNYSNYALPLSGGTMTGALTTPGLTVTGAATFSLAINGSILGNAATASRLLNARMISFTGAFTGNYSFDGSANISINTSHSHSYLPLSGGQMTGPLTWKDETALPQQTSPLYFLVLDAFADGGTTKWSSRASVKSALGLGDLAYINKGSTSGTYLKNDGTWGTPTGTYSLPSRLSEYLTADSSSATYNGFGRVSSGAPFTFLHTNAGDCMTINTAYSSDWAGLLGTDYRTNNIAYRAKNNGTWTEWAVMLSNKNTGFEYSSTISYDTHTKSFICSKSDSNWNAQAYSKDGYLDNVYISFKIGLTNAYIMTGLNSDPTTNASYSSIDYCWYTLSSGNLNIYESDSAKASISGHTTYSVGDEFRIEYSNGYVRYYHNNVLCREVPRAVGSKLYFDSSFYNNGNIYDVQFGTVNHGISVSGGALNDWKQITRTGYSVSWYQGRISAILRLTSYTGYNAILSMKTTNGSWDLGVYSNDTAYFTYITDSNFNADSNTSTYQLVFPKDTGTFALTKQLPTKASWNYDDVYVKLSGSTMTGALTVPSLSVTANGKTVTIGSLNASWCHFTTDVNFYFSPSVWVNGSIGIYNGGSCNYYINNATSVLNDLRVSGADLYIGSASGSQCHQQYDSTNKCLKFIFD